MEQKPLSMTRGDLTVTLALTKLDGNRLAYFSATAELRHPRTGRVESCGAMHDAILKCWPELADFVALHLADENGEPMHSEANGYYWLSGALGGLGEQYNPLNDSAVSVQDCLAHFARHCRITVEQADALIDSFNGGQGKVREQFVAWCALQRPRWKAEAEAAKAKYLTGRAA